MRVSECERACASICVRVRVFACARARVRVRINIGRRDAEDEMIADFRECDVLFWRVVNVQDKKKEKEKKRKMMCFDY